MDRGLFITFEGMDGSGKTTQIKLLTEYLKQKNMSVVSTREPGGTAIGDKIRKILLDSENAEMHSRTEALLYAAARAQHVEQLILPALEAGSIVISDRYADSTFVYQGIARSLAKQDMLALTEFATAGLKPDLTFVLECALQTVEKRVGRRGKRDRLEMEGLAFQERVRDGYREVAKGEDVKRMNFIDTEKSINEIHSEIVVLIEKFIVER